MPLITQEERSELQKMVGSRQTIVASAVAKLMLASPDPKAKATPGSILSTFRTLNNEEWTPTNVVGALCLVIDRETEALVFQIYDLDGWALRFEFELYVDLTYQVLSAQCHAFEIEDCMASFVFADASEAKSYLSKVMALRPTSKAAGGQLLKQQQKKRGFFGGFFGGSSKNAGSIGAPKLAGGGGNIKVGQIRMVQHNQHVGVNADGTFDMKNLPSTWKQMFKEAGIRKKDLQDPETAGALLQVIQQQEMKNDLAKTYQQAPEYQDVPEEELAEAVEQIDDEQLAAYEKYQDELRQYYEELAAWEAEQEALEAWERDNAEVAAAVPDRIELGSDSGGDPDRRSGKVAPPLPPRKMKQDPNVDVKELQREAKAYAKQAKQAEKALSEAVKDYRKSVMIAAQSPERSVFEQAADDARKAAEEARKAAEEAARERDEIMREIEELKQRDAATKSAMARNEKKSRVSLPFRKSTPKKAAPPPLPKTAPPSVGALAPPPPPPLPALPPAPPKAPELPKLAVGNGFLGAIKQGVQLKKTEAPKPKAASPRQDKQLPDLKGMKPSAQSNLMQKLIDTMNERRKAMNEDSDEEDEWSD